MAGRKVLKIRRTTGGPANNGSSESTIESGNDESTVGNEPAIAGDNNNDGGKDDGPSIEQFDPADIITGTDTSSGNGEPRRRGPGRPRGSTNSGRKTKGSSSENIEGILFGLHKTLSVVLQSPEIAISKDEAEELRKAIEQVNELYPEAPVLPPWMVAWGNLAFVAGGIYFPRVIAIKMRGPAKKAKSESPLAVMPTNLIVHPSKVGIEN